MKKVLRGIVSYSVSLYIASLLFSGLHVSGGVGTYLLVGVLMAAAYMLLKPILSIVSLPLNALTLGFFSWILVTLIFIGITKINSNVRAVPFHTYAISVSSFHIPSFSLNQILSYFIISATIYVLANSMEWIFAE